MSKLIVARNVCDVYADTKQSERVTQAIMGQAMFQSAESDEHLHVLTQDLYPGHVRKHAIVPHQKAWKKRQMKQVKTLFAPVHRRARVGSELVTTLVLSTVVPVTRHYRQFARVHFPDGNIGWVRKSDLGMPVASKATRLDPRTIAGVTERALSTALSLVGTPYLWGGCTPYGIDCSGFTQLCYAMGGVQLLRDAWMQMDDARFEPVAEGQSFESAELNTGDLVFFGNNAADGGKRKVTHVGMIMSDGRLIHSAGGYGVTVDERKQHRLAATYLGARRLTAK